MRPRLRHRVSSSSQRRIFPMGVTRAVGPLGCCSSFSRFGRFGRAFFACWPTQVLLADFLKGGPKRETNWSAALACAVAPVYIHRMREPAQTLIGELERIVSALPDAVLFPGLGVEGPRRFGAVMGVPPPPGLATFLPAPDGGVLSPDARLLTLDEAPARLSAAASAPSGPRWQAGLWPV